ncbi:MAG: LysM peptidoglycan-binding domain-containing protein [Patescibacteria group bacterium]|nr:LysM peptidoglycan-binding domain-containing protein [Patescibacteria group bacterium]
MGKTIIKIRYIFFLIAVLLVSLIPANVFALEGGGISILPAITEEYPGFRSWFIYDKAEPGSTIIDKAEVINNKSREVKLNVALLDGATTKSGGYTLVGNIEENKDIGTWSSLSDNFLIIPPRSKKIVDLEIKIPENADVGSHPGGVVIWEDTNVLDKKKSAGQLSVITRVAARIYLTVPGDIIRKIVVDNLSHSVTGNVLYFNMTIENQGNVQITPEIDITLNSLLGELGKQERSQAGIALRGKTIESRIPWQQKTPKFGRFVADFRVHYGDRDFNNEWVDDEYIDVVYTFWLIPWMLIAWWLIGLFVLLFIYRIFLWLRVRQRLNTKTVEHKVKKGETLTTIARKYDVDAKRVARFNMLKWPYDIFPGDILLVPQGKLTKEEKLTKQTTKKSTQVGQNYEPVVVEPDDTLADVAVFANSDVRTIASINKLKWPYKISAGQELLIPVEDKDTSKKRTKKTRTKRKPKKTTKKKSDK